MAVPHEVLLRHHLIRFELLLLDLLQHHQLLLEVLDLLKVVELGCRRDRLLGNFLHSDQLRFLILFLLLVNHHQH
jgi:hypothetical protein